MLPHRKPLGISPADRLAPRLGAEIHPSHAGSRVKSGSHTQLVHHIPAVRLLPTQITVQSSSPLYQIHMASPMSHIADPSTSAATNQNRIQNRRTDCAITLTSVAHRSISRIHFHSDNKIACTSRISLIPHSWHHLSLPGGTASVVRASIRHCSCHRHPAFSASRHRQLIPQNSQSTQKPWS